ncbi:MAG: hypothetical protein J5781_02805 [Clostridia bacterium]|nr:hypothetical protein [Clostridia bacterium]
MKYFAKNRYEEPKEFLYKIESFSGINAAAEQETLPLGYATYGYNVRFSGGAMTQGYGVGYATINSRYLPGMLTVGEAIKKLFLYKRFDRTTGARDDRLIVQSDNEKLYQANLTTDTVFHEINATLGTSNLTFLNCEYNDADVLWISDDHGHLVLYDGTNAVVMNDTPYFSDACFYNGRVFATSGTGNNVLRFSAEGDPTEWAEAEGAGTVTFPDEGGKILRAVQFKEALLVFREYGVWRYVGYPRSSVYTLERIYATERMIEAKSVCVCGDRVIFATGNGFYAYNGSSVGRVFSELFPLADGLDDCAGCYYDNKYYFAFRMKDDGETVGDEVATFKNNAFLAIGMDEKFLSVTRGTDVREFIPVSVGSETALLCAFGGNYHPFDIGMVTDSGKVFSTPLKKKWRSPKTTLSKLSRDKFLRKIFLLSNGAMTLTVDADGKSEFMLPSGVRTHCICVGKRADAVGLELASTADKFTAYGLEMEFDIKRRGFYER